MTQTVSLTEHIHEQQYQTSGKGLMVRAPAKINLALLIGQKRPDNFHELWSIMAKINWYDEILIEPSEKTELICKGTYWAPDGDDNLVLKAAKLLKARTSQNICAKLTLTKNVPAGTGLGSASSDGTAALLGLNKLFGLKLSIADLSELATQLGSDAAFFLGDWMSICEGKGEKISPLTKKKKFAALLAVPDISVSTKKVYENFKPDMERYRLLRDKLVEFVEQNKLDFTKELCANMLQQSCFGLHSQLTLLKSRLEALTGINWCLSGSGSAMYAIIDYRDTYLYRTKLLESGCNIHLVSNNRW